MRNQFDIALDVLQKLFNPQSMIMSAILTAGVGGFSYLSNTQLFGVSVLFVLIVCGFMVVDWFSGVFASVISEKNKFQSNKVTYTIIKFVTFFMWLFFVNQAKEEYSDTMAKDVVLIIQIFVLLLIGLREFVSIGENIERIYGQKPYLFNLIDSVFGTMERIFKKKLESKVDEIEDIIENQDNNEN